MADPKTVSLTIGERVAAMKLFDAFKGSLSVLAILLEDVKGFTISEEEWGKANLVKTPQPDGGETWKWDDTAEPKDITVHDESLTFLKNEIQKKSDAGEITLADVALVSLQGKL